jgi:hypothetical protein
MLTKHLAIPTGKGIILLSQPDEFLISIKSDIIQLDSKHHCSTSIACTQRRIIPGTMQLTAKGDGIVNSCGL